MVKPRNTGLNRVIKATVYSKQGIHAAWRNEAAFRQECVIALVLTPLAFLLGANLVETALLLSVLGLVLITELLNSAIEAVVDRIGEEQHELAGRAKDMGSAAVMVALVLVATTWLLVGLNRIF